MVSSGALASRSVLFPGIPPTLEISTEFWWAATNGLRRVGVDCTSPPCVVEEYVDADIR